MKDLITKIIQNVCSGRTNLELLQIPKNQELCNRGIEDYD